MKHLLAILSLSVFDRMLATGLVWTVVWIGSLQFAPAAHESIHHDAHHEDHHCAVELFNEGVLMGEVAIGIDGPKSLVLALDEIAIAVSDISEAWRTPPGRAPPTLG